MQDLCELLRNNPYPGRGIVVGRGRVYYWIMGRSANSRKPHLSLPRADGHSQAEAPPICPSSPDPSLIIYQHPVRTWARHSW